MLVLTAAPAEALLLPLVAIEFVAAFSAELLAPADDWLDEEEHNSAELAVSLGAVVELASPEAEADEDGRGEVEE